MAFNQGASLPGNLLATFLIHHKKSGVLRPCGNTTAELLVPGWDEFDSPLFLGCACFCALGTIVLALYRPPPRAVDAPSRPPPPTPLESLQRIWKVCVNRNGIRLLLPYMFYTGVSVVFYSGMYTRQMDSEWVGPAMCIFGGAQVVGGLVIGGVIDRLGVRSGGVVIIMVVGSAMTVAHFANVKQDRTLFWIASGLLGLAENGVQTTAYAVLTTRFQKADGDHDTNSSRNDVVSGSEQGNVNGSGEFTDDATARLLSSSVQTYDGVDGVHEDDGNTFHSSDGFSALFLVQGVTIGVMFFILPLSAEKSGRSSVRQFFWEQVVVVGLLFVGMICLFIDTAYANHAKHSRH